MGMVCSTPKYKDTPVELTSHQITTDFPITELTDQPIKSIKLITSPPKPQIDSTLYQKPLQFDNDIVDEDEDVDEVCSIGLIHHQHNPSTQIQTPQRSHPTINTMHQQRSSIESLKGILKKAKQKSSFRSIGQSQKKVRFVARSQQKYIEK